jgi:phytoene dehydrogenase-like protein
VKTKAPVEEVWGHRVRLGSGERMEADAVVVAADAPSAEELLLGMPPRRMNAVTCLYFAAPEPPVRGPYLVLNGEGRGPVNHLAVMSEVAPSYAPAGQALVSVSVLEAAEGSEALETRVREQLTEWFGGAVAGWRHLRTYAIAHALPAQPPESFEEPHRQVRLSPGLYVCGDYRENGSIEGAMVSGRRAAEALLRDRDLD